MASTCGARASLVTIDLALAACSRYLRSFAVSWETPGIMTTPWVTQRREIVRREGRSKCRRLWVLCVHVCVWMLCMHVCVCAMCMCVWRVLCMHMCVWRRSRDNLRCHSSSTIYLVFETWYFIALELASWPKLASCWALGIHLSLPPQGWDYKHVSSHLASFLFKIGSGDPTQYEENGGMQNRIDDSFDIICCIGIEAPPKMITLTVTVSYFIWVAIKVVGRQKWDIW